MRWLAPAAVALALAACGPPPCVSSTACGAGRVCGLDGRCGPLAPPSGSRFAGSRWVAAIDWGVTPSSAGASDVLRVGGPSSAEGLLAFAPLPSAGGILRALLVLTPHEPAAPVTRTGEIVVEHVGAFQGGRLPARHAQTPLPFAAARVALPAGPARPVRVDVTSAARAAAGRGDHTLYLLVRLAGGDPDGARFASPWAPGLRVQPRLELLLN